jgi:Saxitoxin biosynthesis operon protein SxtJ
MVKGATHEDFNRNKEVVVGSDRSFGLVFTGFFTLAGLLPLVRGTQPRLWLLGIAPVILIVTILFPNVLHPFNVAWARFALMLNRIVSPIVMGMVFYGAVTPVGMLLRKFGPDSLRLRRDSSSTSCWIVRDPAGPPPDTLKNQF